MKIELRYKHYSGSQLIKDIEIEGIFKDYCTYIKGQDYQINEQKLIDMLPKNFLPVKPQYIFLAIQDGSWSIGQINLNVFKPWVREFYAYMLDIVKPQ